jgi:SAM-dependent methyltransferase
MTKPGDYYGRVREEIAPLLQKDAAAAVLDLGCGAGATLAWLKAQGFCGRTVGVEVAEQCRDEARRNVDEFHAARIEATDFPPASFDCVLILDVLEHLVDPEGALRRVHPWVKPAGRVIVSLPNVRNMTVLRKLIVNGRWDYAESGILDEDHLRFFSLRSARDLAARCGYRVEAERYNYNGSGWAVILKRMPFLREFAVYQLLFSLARNG